MKIAVGRTYAACGTKPRLGCQSFDVQAGLRLPLMGMAQVEVIVDHSVEPAIRGFLHRPSQDSGNAVVLTHGAGANCQSKLLVALSEVFAEAGFLALRCDLPFRQARPHSPPFPAMAVRDREGLGRAAGFAKQTVSGKVFLGGHSYGGRQATILMAEQPDLADGLLLLSYPLHPPRKPADLRTAHFPRLQTPALFVHGDRDPFATEAEMRSALQLIPARTQLFQVDRAGHDLIGKGSATELPRRIVAAFLEFFGGS